MANFWSIIGTTAPTINIESDDDDVPDESSGSIFDKAIAFIDYKIIVNTAIGCFAAITLYHNIQTFIIVSGGVIVYSNRKWFKMYDPVMKDKKE
jgi:hypothetical protein